MTIETVAMNTTTGHTGGSCGTQARWSRTRRRACAAGRGRTDVHVTRPAGERRLPEVGVDHPHIWSRSAESLDVEREEVRNEHPPHGSATFFACFVWNVQCIGHSCQAMRGSAKCWRRRSLLVGTRGLSYEVTASHPCWHVHDRFESWQLLLTRRCNAIPEQVSNKTEPRKLHGRSTRQGLRRQIPEDHDVLRWLVHHAAATVNWSRPGPDFV